MLGFGEILCSHKWEKLSETTLPSAFEQFTKHSQPVEANGIPAWVYRKKFILILKCGVCASSIKP